MEKNVRLSEEKFYEEKFKKSGLVMKICVNQLHARTHTYTVTFRKIGARRQNKYRVEIEI
jgi:hypothetical protein